MTTGLFPARSSSKIIAVVSSRALTGSVTRSKLVRIIARHHAEKAAQRLRIVFHFVTEHVVFLVERTSAGTRADLNDVTAPGGYPGVLQMTMVARVSIRRLVELGLSRARRRRMARGGPDAPGRPPV
jgi:hypothetical protein